MSYFMELCNTTNVEVTKEQQPIVHDIASQCNLHLLFHRVNPKLLRRWSTKDRIGGLIGQENDDQIARKARKHVQV